MARRVKILYGFFIAVLFIFSVFLAFSARTYHYNQEADAIAGIIQDRPIPPKDLYHKFMPLLRDNFVPFTIESAIMYSYTKKLADGKDISGKDNTLLGMENISVGSQMSLGLEYFLAYGYKLKCRFFPPPQDNFSPYEDNPDFSNWIRFQIRMWTSLTAGFVFLWLIIMRVPWYFALSGAVMYSFMPSAIARYTGQDLIRGEFCMPLIAATFTFAFWYFRSPSSLKLLLFAVFAFSSMAFWDICQIAFGIWALFELTRLLIQKSLINNKRRNFWIVFYVILVLDALFIPYHRTHRLLFSPLVFIIMPSIVIVYCFGKGKYMKRLCLILISLTVLSGIWYAALKMNSYSDNYSHFGELLKAKIKYMNEKPEDPSLLNFDARMLWTPMMHSVTSKTWHETKFFVPYAVYGFVILMLFALLFRHTRKKILRSLPYSYMPYFMTGIYFAMFIFVVRYHDFCALFLSVSFPLLTYGLIKSYKSALPKAIILVVFLLFIYADTKMCFMLQRKYDIGGPLKESSVLLKWLRQADMKEVPILAEMSISPLFKAYCDSKILLQPQFELGKTRKFVEDYLRIMFHGTEEELNKFCAANNIKFIVYDFSCSYLSSLAIYSNRYIADGREVNKNSPAYLFYHYPTTRKWFYKIAPPSELRSVNRAYFVFKVILPKDRMQALDIISAAENELSQGNTETAKALAAQAYKLDPVYEPVSEFYYKLFQKLPPLSLKDLK